VAPTLSAFDFALGLVPNVEFDLGLVVCVMEKRDFSLIRVLAIYPKHNFMLVLAVNLQCDDRSPGLFRSQHSQVLGAENSNLPWLGNTKE
jgi:hypothetical protein